MIGFRRLSLAVSLAALPLAAEAQPFQGFYIGAGAGYNLPQNVEIQSGSVAGLPANLGSSLNLNGNIVGLGSVGYALGNGMRFELEGSYRKSNVSGLSRTFLPGFVPPAGATGTLQTYAVMVNAQFDIDIGVPWLFPYIGGGAGYAWTHAGDLRLTPFVLPAAAPGAAFSATQGNFAYQVIAGLSFPIPNVPGLSVTSEYRFFGTVGDETFTGSSVPLGAPVSFKLGPQHNHSFLVGVRYAFSAVPPLPVPLTPIAPPAAAPSRSYLIFFDWDKASLTDRARQIVKEAADNSTRVAYTRIEVNGYTDTSGTKQYNQGLSVRRAQAVQAELIKDGVPPNAITVQGYGDTKLLVATGPGVREPQNRRVEIVIR